MSKNAAIAGEDSRPALRPCYCYAVRDAAGGSVFFLTNFDKDVVISGLPAKWGGSDPQTFSSASIDHGSINREQGISEQSFQLRARIHNVQDYSRYILFGMIPKIEVGIIKVTSGAAVDELTAAWGTDTLLVHSGIVTDFTVEGFEVQVGCVPQPFLTSHQVPRWRYTRTCNHQLYGAACTVVASSFEFSNSILSLDEDNRQVTVSGQRVSTLADHWRGGVLVHNPSGVRLTIFAAELSGGNTILSLHQWSPDMAATDSVTLNAGCDHTSNTCESKFSNLANFGGFPMVPNKNPGLHGVD